ncbi:MAG: hypothetical protein LBR60_00610 [Fibrobacter sp.]|jgi:hypothetical protein|nr:hypothetical protein [Fibrobacter sp.]
MNKLKETIDSQIESNKSKNLFHEDFSKIMRFSKSTLEAILNLKDIKPDHLNVLIDYSAEQVLQEFCRINQYFSFQKEDKLHLKSIYKNLYEEIIKGEVSINDLSQTHFSNLKTWLNATNPFSQKMYRRKGTTLEPVACSEYSAELQKEILHLDQIHLMEPILDIGCGKEAHLVKHLRSQGFEAYGIDRFSNELPYLQKADWLNFDCGVEKWGAITSNLGFSNHFIHHHLREDGSFIEYAKKYMDILNSLKTGGCFCYAPDLPFIEEYLDEKNFLIKKYDIKNLSFKTTIIKRLR